MFGQGVGHPPYLRTIILIQNQFFQTSAFTANPALLLASQGFEVNSAFNSGSKAWHCPGGCCPKTLNKRPCIALHCPASMKSISSHPLNPFRCLLWFIELSQYVLVNQYQELTPGAHMTPQASSVISVKDCSGHWTSRIRYRSHISVTKHQDILRHQDIV